MPASFVCCNENHFPSLYVFAHPEKSVQITSSDTSTKVLNNNFENDIIWKKQKKKKKKELQVEQNNVPSSKLKVRFLFIRQPQYI